MGTLAAKEFPVLDFELPYALTPVQQTRWIVEWCNEVENKTGKVPWLYTDSSTLEELDTSELTKYPLWLANYEKDPDKDHPPDAGAWGHPTAWQFTDKAAVPGVIDESRPKDEVSSG